MRKKVAHTLLKCLIFKKVAVTIKTMTNKREPITQVGSLSCSYPFVHAINLS